MTDAYRELASQHQGALTVRCECPNVPAMRVDYSPACTFCNDTGRRPLTLEELLTELATALERRDARYGGPAHANYRKYALVVLGHQLHWHPGESYSEGAAHLLLELRELPDA